MKEYKRRLELFLFFDHAGIARHLERMAAQGWMLDKQSSFGWRYRRIEPKTLHFAVTYFPQASEFDPEPSEKQRMFEDFCAEAGWKHVSSLAQMQVFVNEAEAPVPIETDALTQVETIHAAMKKNFLPAQFLLLFAALLNAALLIARLRSDPVGVLSSNANLLSGGCWLTAVLLCAVDLLIYFRWRRKALAAARESDEVVQVNARGRQIAQRAVLTILFAILICFLISLSGSPNLPVFLAGLLYPVLLFVLVNGIKNLMKQQKVKTGVNRAVTITACILLSFAMTGGLVFFIVRAAGSGAFDETPAETYEYQGITWEVYRDALPLTVQDLTGGDGALYSRQWTEDRSLLLERYKASDRARMDAGALPNLGYAITKIKIPALYGFCLNGILEDHRFDDPYLPEFASGVAAEDAGIWEADAVYRCYLGEEPLDTYVVCWPNKIVEITFFFEPTDAQIVLAAQKLKDV